VKAPPAKRAKEARLPYDVDALKAVFGSAIYTKGERPNRGAGEAAYWLPLLALYTGARLGELGQLRPKDIVQEVYQDAEDEDRKHGAHSVKQSGGGADAGHGIDSAVPTDSPPTETGKGNSSSKANGSTRKKRAAGSQSGAWSTPWT
jgi:hypothetical protein